MAEETQYRTSTGLVTISTANSNLDGTGTLGTVITAAGNGTLIKTVIIKAVTSTSQGMVRLFVDEGGNIRLLKEILVPAITKAAINPAFEAMVDLNFFLESGCLLKASTENADTFNIIAEGQDVNYYSYRVRMDTTKYTANNGTGIIDTANTELDGSGTMASVFSTSGPKGSSISSITVKALQNVTPGMVRLFIYNGTTKFLFKEIIVSTETYSPTDQTFERTIEFENDYELMENYGIYASTENTETFHVMVEANDVAYYS